LPRRVLLFTAAAAGTLFLLLAVLVVHGTFTHLDQHAVSNLMPWLQPPFHTGVQVTHLFVPRLGDSVGEAPVALSTYPAGALPSALVLACCTSSLRRRGLGRAAAVWWAAWLVANAVEVAGKTIVVRPALHSHGLHVASYDQSYPSGHMLRAAVLSAAVVYTWRRAWPVLLWIPATAIALVVLGDHTPTDVAGALLAAVALVLGALYACARWVTSPSTTVSTTGSDGSSSARHDTGSSASTVRSAA
jgi:membrane-associated phospholipid phosphatase